MNKIFNLLIAQLIILLTGTFLQQKGFIELQQFYAYVITPVACIAALILRDIYILKKIKD
jgi:hypothetical protein